MATLRLNSELGKLIQMLRDVVDSVELVHRVREPHPTVGVHVEYESDSVTYYFSHPDLGLSLKCKLPLIGQLAPYACETIYLHERSDAEKAIQAVVQAFKTWQGLGR